MLTFLDFFAGIGGFRRGMEMAGHKCMGHCEWDKYANVSYAAIHNIEEGEWFGKDIRDTRANELPRADVWCFGFPCQDISIAGKQLGFNGNRSSLFFTVTRLIRDTKEEDRPKYLFIENVKNLLSINGGVDFLKLLIELDEIGYDAEWQVLNSKDFGVPQNRERVFIIGHLRGRSRQEVFPIGEKNSSVIKERLKFNPNRHSSLMNSILDAGGITPALDCMQGGNRQPKVLINIDKGKIKAREDFTCLDANYYKGLDNHAARTGVMVKEATKQGYAIATEGDSINLEQPNSKTRRGRVGKGIANTLTCSCNQGTLDGYRIRKLTPKECFRLQGWNDEDFEKAKKALNDTFYKGRDDSASQLYKQAGNGVTVNVIYEIAKRLEEE